MGSLWLGRYGFYILVTRAKLDGLVASKEPVACLALRAKQNSKGLALPHRIALRPIALYGLNGRTTAVV